MLTYAATGAIIGLIIGITGVGGGALMTPALLFFGFPAHIAVGTDLWYAALTKTSGLWTHHKKNHIRWRIALNMATGSLPAAILTGVVLSIWFGDAQSYGHILKSALGFMLIVTAVMLILRSYLSKTIGARGQTDTEASNLFSIKLILVGVLLGILVTLSSVGAGAVGTAVLMMLYPRLLPKEIVGTDIAHAVPLTFIAGLIHLHLGNVNFTLLAALLIGSIPAINIGAMISSSIPARYLNPALASLLLLLGLRYALF
ncbi:sulfite exporter TauE/SafE family protein [Reinekea thalattae]